MEQIAIAGDDFNAKPTFYRLARHAAEDVVSFVTFHFEARDVKCVDELAYTFDLRAQVVWHLSARAFIIRKQIVAECPPGVKSYCQEVRIFLIQNAQKDAGKTEHPGCRLSAAGLESRS